MQPLSIMLMLVAITTCMQGFLTVVMPICGSLLGTED